ncbi:MAG: SLBB domain-containing protein [Candidatus Aminicenantes bacterium]|nr:SLBB domain-containing protein [Candidatus Aminicenantes bacterium]
MSNRAEKIIQAVQEAGVIGAGGGGFPTHAKLKAQVDTVIANGSECEPLLASEKNLLNQHAESVLEGLALAMEATGAKRGFVALKEHNRDAIQAVQKALSSGDGRIRIHRLENYYPAGDEFLTVYDVTGWVVPEGGLPLDVGVVVCNALTLSQVADAFHGKPVTERPVTVAGSVRKPAVVVAPIGTPYADLLAKAGGARHADDVLIDGGPMMGNLVADPRLGIARTTSGVLALPADHLIVRLKKTSIAQMVKRSKAACCQCFRCSDLCPRHLLGHNLHPHLAMRSLDYGLAEPSGHVTAAFLCSQCGVCELLACDAMLLSPRLVLAEYKKQLIARGIKNPHGRTKLSALAEISYRRIPVSTVLKKTGISEYAVETPFAGYLQAELVRVPLCRHAGAPAVARVKKGEKVKMGKAIAETPAGMLGAVCHASIAGTITAVNEDWIEISAK